jgi:TonB-linked SusC/RagA family outer membrane protein
VRGFSGAGPLYVVDGIPIDDPASINMDAVESINVLKGASAAALWGSRAREGVIMIKTKSAKEGDLNIDFNSTTQFENVSVLPGYQNQYGGGYSQDFQTFSYDPAIDAPELAGLDGANIPEFYADESWGPAMEGQQVAQWDAFIPGTEGYGQTRAWTPNEDNVRDFFDTGVNLTNSLTVGKGGEGYNVSATFTNVNRSGVMPNTEQNRNFLNLNASIDLTKGLTLNAMGNYSSTNTFGNLFEGYNGLGSNFNQWFQRQLDMDLLEKYYRMPDGRYTSWNMNSARNPRPLYWDNPYTVQYGNTREAQEEVYNGAFGLSYEVIDGLTLSANLRRYYRSGWSEGRTATGTLDQDQYFERMNTRTEDNYEFMARYEKVFENFSIGGLIGGNIRKETGRNNYISTVGGLSVADLYNISASIERPATSNYKFDRRVNSVFAQLNFGWREMIFIDATIRRDWDSVLPDDTPAFTYPSVSLNFIWSELLNNQSFLSFGKAYASYAEVGGELNPYQLDPVYGLGTPYGSNPVMGVPNSLIDPTLRASTTSAIEAGVELGFWNNRLTFDFAYYYYDNSNEILSTQVPSTTGITNYTINAGKTYTKGWDASIGGTPVRSGDFQWDVNFNIAQSRNTVEEIFEGIDAITLGNAFRGTSSWGGWGGITARAKVGEEWGAIVGRKFARNDAGELIVSSSGRPTFEDNQVLGQILPDFTGGIFNRFTYKNFELSFTIDWQSGGAFHSFTKMFNAYSGLGEMTVGNNDQGNPMRDPVGEGGGLTFGGVFEDGTANDIYLEADAYWKSLFGLHENWVYDASYVKLREIRFGYNLPQSLLARTNFIKRASIAFVSNDTWLIHTNVPGIDPSQISGDTRNARNNGAWVDGGQLPATRTLGFDIRLGF